MLINDVVAMLRFDDKALEKTYVELSESPQPPCQEIMQATVNALAKSNG